MSKQFRTWDELTDLEKAQCTYSDMYKDQYGFRPRPNADKLNDLEWLDSEIEYLSSLPLDDDPGFFPTKDSLSY